MKTCSETYQFEKDLKLENPAPGVNRQIMAYDGQLMMVKVKFDKGAVGSMHEHYHNPFCRRRLLGSARRAARLCLHRSRYPD